MVSFNFTQGEIALDNGLPSSAAFDIDVNTPVVLDIEEAEENAELVTHLRSADFFDSESYPTGRFELVSVAVYDSSAFSDTEEYASEYAPQTSSSVRVEGPTHNITGNLTLRGITRSITFPARVSIESDQFSAEASFNINRTEFGISYGDESSVVDRAKDAFVYNTVNVGFVLVATPATTPVETEEEPTT